ncbi:von Willebrand domain containing protein [Sclerotinia borealis F-4128]|uniref:von Willebrand domain containing protein n=1 Tax=Sclerotinia borealis (strain F-4128) TaxID=1432307 RepID=W9C908_SCLBF|nr:von Willebrand domain containing protein [Sclerotinia borealis F-4128]
MASATLAQESAVLERDFVLLVTVKDLGNPKAMLETHSTISNHRALMVSLVPKFTLPAHRPEIVFVVDRSGSMRDKMPMVISAMKVFLKSLPVGTHFNICSFGTSYSFLWAKSKQYTPDSLKEALQRIRTFLANLGGTETLKALTAAIENRLPDLPLEIMLLTDENIWQQSECFEYLNGEVNKSQGKIRVFPLGIGESVSHALINGIARAGNGFSQTVQRGENMGRSVVRMLRGALHPHITDYTVAIKYESEDDDFEIIERVTDSMKFLLSNIDKKPEQPEEQNLPTISLFDPTVEDLEDTVMQDAPPRQLPDIPTPKLLQAPDKIPSLFPGVNTVVYLLMSPETIQRNPTTVVLKGKSAHGPVELSIPIEILPVPSNTIHQLAARKATQDLEESRGWVYNVEEDKGGLKDCYPSQFADIVKREAVRLGQQFQIANRWCSFVAVADNDAESIETFNSVVVENLQQSKDQVKVNARTRPASDGFSERMTRNRQVIPPPILDVSNKLSRSVRGSTTTATTNTHTLNPTASFWRSSGVSVSSNEATSMSMAQDVHPGVRRQEDSVPGTDYDYGTCYRMRDTYEGDSSPNFDHTYNSAILYRRTAPARRRRRQESRAIAPSNSSSEIASGKDWAIASSVERVLKIIDLQQFEGTWILLPDIEPILRFKVPQDVFDVAKNATAKKMWITLIVLYFLEQTMAREVEISELVIAKAKMWLSSTKAKSVPEIEQMKKAALEVVGQGNGTVG